MNISIASPSTATGMVKAKNGNVCACAVCFYSSKYRIAAVVEEELGKFPRTLKIIIPHYITADKLHNIA